MTETCDVCGRPVADPATAGCERAWMARYGVEPMTGVLFACERAGRLRAEARLVEYEACRGTPPDTARAVARRAAEDLGLSARAEDRIHTAVYGYGLAVVERAEQERDEALAEAEALRASVRASADALAAWSALVDTLRQAAGIATDATPAQVVAGTIRCYRARGDGYVMLERERDEARAERDALHAEWMQLAAPHLPGGVEADDG